MLRKRIGELQQYRKLGLTTAADIKKWEDDLYKRVRFAYLTPPCFTTHGELFQTQAKANMTRDHFSSERLQQLRAASARQSLGPDASRRNGGVEVDRKSIDQASTGPSGRRPRA